MLRILRVGLFSFLAVAAIPAQSIDLYTPPIAENIKAYGVPTPPTTEPRPLLNCSIVNVSSKDRHVTIQVVDTLHGPLGTPLEVMLGPGKGATMLAEAAGHTSNGPGPCKPQYGNCVGFSGTAYCHFFADGSRARFRAVGCVWIVDPGRAGAAVTSPTCVEAR